MTPEGAFDTRTCAADINLTFANAMAYNAAGTTFHNHAKALTSRFKRRMDKLPRLKAGGHRSPVVGSGGKVAAAERHEDAPPRPPSAAEASVAPGGGVAAVPRRLPTAKRPEKGARPGALLQSGLPPTLPTPPPRRANASAGATSDGRAGVLAGQHSHSGRPLPPPRKPSGSASGINASLPPILSRPPSTGGKGPASSAAEGSRHLKRPRIGEAPGSTRPASSSHKAGGGSRAGGPAAGATAPSRRPPPLGASAPLPGSPGSGADVEGSGDVAQSRKRQRQQSVPSWRSSPAYMAYRTLLDEMLMWPHAEDFARPVFEIWSSDDLPGYSSVVTRPMDIGTVRRSMEQGMYVTPAGTFHASACAADVSLTFANAMAYNAEGTTFHAEAKALATRFSERVAALDASLAALPPRSHGEQPARATAAGASSTSSKIPARRVAAAASPSAAAARQPPHPTHGAAGEASPRRPGDTSARLPGKAGALPRGRPPAAPSHAKRQPQTTSTGGTPLRRRRRCSRLVCRGSAPATAVGEPQEGQVSGRVRGSASDVAQGRSHTTAGCGRQGCGCNLCRRHGG